MLERDGDNLEVIKLSQIIHRYTMGQVGLQVLNGIDMAILKGEYVSIMGPSGSGKSTLLNILGCLDQPTAGAYLLNGIETHKLSDAALSDIRNQHIGFIFQNFHLLNHLTALENVELPLVYSGIGGKERKERALAALDSVGLKERSHHRPTQLSGGEKQRVAIARAIVSQPSLILADEPTGALDSNTGKAIMEIFKDLNQVQGMTIIQVTHDPKVAEKSQKTFHILDGKIDRIEINKETHS